MFSRERSILFGILAIQLRGISTQRVAMLSAEAERNPPHDLGALLVSDELLSDGDCRRLNALVDEAIEAHGGDVNATLANFGAEELVVAIAHSRPAAPEPGPDSITLPFDRAAYAGGRPLDAPGVEETPGRYTSEGEYARGGMGRVLLVHDEHLRRDVALKELLPPGPGATDAATPVRISMSKVARFLQEARITGQLEHPSIVPVYELGRRREGTLYYTMKLVRGKTMSQVLRDCPNAGARLSMLPHFMDLCHAIAYAHSRGVLHRDIKPANVMIGEFGETVVLDWGLAKHHGDTDVHESMLADALHDGLEKTGYVPDRTQYGQAVGTPNYMAPEQATGNLTKVDERSDVYSLGAVLYQILTGVPPHQGESHQIVLRKVISDAPQPIASLVPDVPEELAAICARAIHRSPEQRYQTANALAADVQRYLSGALVQAYRYKFSEHLRRFVLRNKAIVGISAAALLALLAIGAYYNVHLYRARAAERKQRVEVEAANKKLSWENYASSLAEVQINIAEQNWSKAEEVLLRQPLEYRNWEWGQLLRVCRPDVYTYKDDARRGMTGMPLRAIVSPDERFVLNMHDFGGVKTVFDIRSGEVVHISPPDRFVGWPWCSRFTRRPGVFAFGRDERTVELYGFAEDSVLATFAVESGWLSSFALSPDETLAAGYRTSPDTDERELIFWSCPSGEEVRRVPLAPLPEGRYKDAGWATDHEVPHGIVLCFLPDGRNVLCTDSHVCLVDSTNGERTEIERCKGGVAAYAPRANAVALWSLDNTIQLYSLDPVSKIAETTDILHGFRDLDISGDAKYFAVTDARSFVLYDGAAQRVREYNVDSGNIESLVLGPIHHFAVTYGAELSTKYWDLSADPVTIPLRFHGADGAPADPRLFYNPWAGFVYTVTPRKDRLLFGFPDGRIEIWRLPDLSLERIWNAHAGPVTALAVSPDEKTLVSTSADGTAKAWREGADGPVWTLQSESISFPKCVAYAPDGTRLAIGFAPVRPEGEGKRELWAPYGMEENVPRTRHSWFINPDTGEKTGELDDSVYATSMLAFSPDGTTLVRGSWGRPGTDFESVGFFDGLSGARRTGSIKAMGWAHSAAFVPGSTRVFLLGTSLEPVLCDWAEQRELYRLTRYSGFQIVVHPNTQRFFVVDHSRQRMTVHASVDGRHLSTVRGTMLPAILLDDGRSLIAGSTNGHMNMFEVDDWSLQDEGLRDRLRLARLQAMVKN